MKKELTCIGCPLGCLLSVSYDETKPLFEDGIEVTGNTCPRGAVYAKKEIIAPTRIVTSSIRVKNGRYQMVSCKTESDIPKDSIFDVMDAIHATEVESPIKIGDVLIENVACTGISIVATKNIEVE